MAGYSRRMLEKLKVLIVDDDPDEAGLFGLKLYERGIGKIHYAKRIGDVEDFAKKHKPDIAIVDTWFRMRPLGPYIGNKITKASSRTYVAGTSVDYCPRYWDGKSHGFYYLADILPTEEILSGYFDWVSRGRKAPVKSKRKEAI